LNIQVRRAEATDGKVAVSWLKIANPNPTILSHETATYRNRLQDVELHWYKHI